MSEPDSEADQAACGGGSRPDAVALAWAIAVSLSPGWVSYALTRADPLAFLNKNDPEQSAIAVFSMHALASVLLVAALASVFGRGSSTKDRLFDGISRLRVLVVGPFLVALLSDAEGIMSVRRPILVLACALLFTWTVPVARVATALRLDRVRALFGERTPIVVVGVAAGTVAMVLGKLAVMRHVALQTRAFDLGIYDNIMWNTSHGRFLACSLVKSGVHTAAHFDPILVLLVPAYALVPRAETLLVVQTLWLVSGVVPLWFLVFDRLGRR